MRGLSTRLIASVVVTPALEWVSLDSHALPCLEYLCLAARFAVVSGIAQSHSVFHYRIEYCLTKPRVFCCFEYCSNLVFYCCLEYCLITRVIPLHRILLDPPRVLLLHRILLYHAACWRPLGRVGRQRVETGAVGNKDRIRGRSC